jgi:hypothetical protein
VSLHCCDLRQIGLQRGHTVRVRHSRKYPPRTPY